MSVSTARASAKNFLLFMDYILLINYNYNLTVFLFPMLDLKQATGYTDAIPINACMILHIICIQEIFILAICIEMFLQYLCLADFASDVVTDWLFRERHLMRNFY